MKRRTKSSTSVADQPTLWDLAREYPLPRLVKFVPPQFTPKPMGNLSTKGYSRRRKFYEQQAGKCAYCDRQLPGPEYGNLDHILPRSKGGKRKGNLAFVCVPCNLLKAWFATYDEAKTYADTLIAFFENLKDRGFVQ